MLKLRGGKVRAGYIIRLLVMMLSREVGATVDRLK
jgi:hypothetical protein